MRKVNTIFTWCNDIESMRRFYTDLLGLQETFYDAERGWLSHQVQDTLLVFTRAPSELPVIDEWPMTPAREGGRVYASSWVLEVGPDEFDAVVEKLSGAGVECWGPPADRSGGRDFFVRDPMGTTVEVYAASEPAG
ncbi:MAG TPA: VOC family protein [Actinomycetota bacterium]|nr:VOC family protein [Actinomycetota bacterium]